MQCFRGHKKGDRCDHVSLAYMPLCVCVLCDTCCVQFERFVREKPGADRRDVPIPPFTCKLSSNTGEKRC